MTITDEDLKKMEEFSKILNKIINDEITKEEAIAEYMKLGDSREMAEGTYFEIKSDMIKAENNWL